MERMTSFVLHSTREGCSDAAIFRSAVSVVGNSVWVLFDGLAVDQKCLQDVGTRSWLDLLGRATCLQWRNFQLRVRTCAGWRGNLKRGYGSLHLWDACFLAKNFNLEEG